MSKFEKKIPKDKNTILLERAEKLSLPLTCLKESGRTIDILEFSLSDGVYGIESSCIQEAFIVKDITLLPTSHRFIHGLINIRRKIFSVVDLNGILEISKSAQVFRDKAIIIANAEMEFAFLVDNIIQVNSIRLDLLQPALPTFSGIKQEYLKGITQNRVAVLDVNKILADKNLIIEDPIE